MPRTPANPPSLTVNHALYIGQVLGTLLKGGIDVVPITDSDGNYTNRITLTVTGQPLILMIPAPPDTWRFDPLA